MSRSYRHQRGLSLLEVLLAIILLAMVIMATATVYPGGYKLNTTNKYTNQATDIARGIIEEINMRPFSAPGGILPGTIEALSLRSDTTGDSLDQWDYNMSTDHRWPYFNGEASLNEWHDRSPLSSWESMYDKTPDSTGYKQFYLPEQGSVDPPQGISIDFEPDVGSWGLIGAGDTIVAKIEVTVAWVEWRNGNKIPKFVTITSWRTNNKNDF